MAIPATSARRRELEERFKRLCNTAGISDEQLEDARCGNHQVQPRPPYGIEAVSTYVADSEEAYRWAMRSLSFSHHVPAARIALIRAHLEWEQPPTAGTDEEIGIYTRSLRTALGWVTFAPIFVGLAIWAAFVVLTDWLLPTRWAPWGDGAGFFLGVIVAVADGFSRRAKFPLLQQEIEGLGAPALADPERVRLFSATEEATGLEDN